MTFSGKWKVGILHKVSQTEKKKRKLLWFPHLHILDFNFYIFVSIGMCVGNHDRGRQGLKNVLGERK